jgi:hypothetical protein
MADLHLIEAFEIVRNETPLLPVAGQNDGDRDPALVDQRRMQRRPARARPAG